MMRSKLIIGIVLVLCVLATWLFGHLYRELLFAYEQTGTLSDSEYSWVFRLLLNLVGYSTVLLPCYVLYKYLEKTNYFDKISNNSWISRLLFACFSEHERIPESVKPLKEEENTKREVLELAFCFTGLMGAYLVWGLLQEKIMTQKYIMPDGSEQRFDDSQFLVFINRLLGFLIALVRLLSTGQQVIAAPLYKFSYCSLTNIISAWCQYEALKYVSFPTQVLSKSCKVIPVMLMGKLISRNKYEGYEYGTAVLISHPVFVSDCLLLSASSAVGQLLIYRTIARFGPVLFTIIMTLRQAVSILLSCAVYGHSISAEGCVGVVLVFAAVFLRIYCRKRKPAAVK